MPQQVQLVDVNGNPLSSSNGQPINIAQVGGIATQMGAAGGTMVLANSPAFVPGLFNGGSNLNPWQAATGDNAGTGNAGQISAMVVNSSGNLDRKRGNVDNITLINAAAVTTTQTSADQANYNMHLLYVVVNVTTLNGTSPTLTPMLQGKGPVSVQYFQIGAALTAIAATGKFIYLYGISVPAAAGGVTATVAFPIPRTWNFVMTAGGTITNATYTVEASYIS